MHYTYLSSAVEILYSWYAVIAYEFNMRLAYSLEEIAGISPKRQNLKWEQKGLFLDTKSYTTQRGAIECQ
jgi:hypothetical protein